MPPPLSIDIRRLIVTWNETESLTNAELATRAGCCERTVSEILRQHRLFGDPQNLLAGRRGPRRACDAGDVQHIVSLLQTNPTLYLDELSDRLFTDRGVDVSMSTISRILDRLSISHKATANEAAERDELLRATWQAAHAEIPKEYCVWLDESGVDNLTNHRDSGWAEVGQACVRRTLFLRGVRYSVLPALTVDGIIALDIFEGSVTKARFLRFLQEQLIAKLNPYPGRNSVVIMDNCTIHHDEDIRKLIEDECGAKLVYLPPYSPDFNPIEQTFHSLKAWLRRHECEATNAAVRPWLIHQAAMQVSKSDAMGWVLNCGYT